MPSISHMLWFDSQAEEAANFYVNIFPDGKVTNVAKGPDGKAFTVNFSILGKDYIGLNGRSFLSNWENALEIRIQRNQATRCRP